MSSCKGHVLHMATVKTNVYVHVSLAERGVEAWSRKQRPVLSVISALQGLYFLPDERCLFLSKMYSLLWFSILVSTTGMFEAFVCLKATCIISSHTSSVDTLYTVLCAVDLAQLKVALNGRSS